MMNACQLLGALDSGQTSNYRHGQSAGGSDCGMARLVRTIVDVGLICVVTITADNAQMRMIVTSAACPVADLIA